jgi:hypothetical protein
MPVVPLFIVEGPMDNWDTATDGIIFEFKEMEQAKAFAAAVKKRFGLDGRVFDDAEAAARAHGFPWAQKPPVVHIDRPMWEVLAKKLSLLESPEGKAARKAERQIKKMARKFGGTWVGT